MSSHNAQGQMLGYLYQVRYTLNLILDSDNPHYQISLEKFDDVAFEDNGSPVEMLQLKHHVHPGNLGDTSTDLWRTLNVWMDQLNEHPLLLDDTDFIIITTADVTEGSAAYYFQTHNSDKAYELLYHVSIDNKNQTNKSYYLAFKNAASKNEQSLKKLLSHIRIISCAKNATDIEKQIEKQIRYSCKPQFIKYVLERVEGWWFKSCIDALSSDNPIITTQSEIRNKVVDISRQYDDDNLPIEFSSLVADLSKIAPEDRIFLEQLKLLRYSSRMLDVALRDYYRAYAERSNWIRKGLIYSNELEDYEDRLKDAWDHAYAEMVEDIDYYGDDITEDEKVKAGRELFLKLNNKDIRIRDKVNASYVMKGTYHDMANSLKIGWHIDFYERLKNLLVGV